MSKKFVILSLASLAFVASMAVAQSRTPTRGAALPAPSVAPATPQQVTVLDPFTLEAIVAEVESVVVVEPANHNPGHQRPQQRPHPRSPHRPPGRGPPFPWPPPPSEPPGQS